MGETFDPMATALENIGRDLLATRGSLSRAVARADAATARAERAEAAIQRAKKIHSPILGTDDTQWCAVCSQEEQQPAPVGWWVPWPCPTVAALDSTDPGSDK